MAAPAPPGLTGMDADKLKLVQDLEIEMMTDMYSRFDSLNMYCHFTKRLFKKQPNFL